jgi:signal transduction histidine kinase
MLFSGLKMQIAGTLVVLLTLSILLGNMVFAAFWQKEVIRAEVEHVRSVWADLSKNPNNPNPNQLEIYDELKAFCRYTSKQCAGVGLTGNDFWLKNDLPKIQAKSLELALETAVSQKEILRIEGNPWGMLSSAKKYLFIAEPLKSDTIVEPKAAVVIIELNSIYETIFQNKKAIFVYLLVNVILLTIVGFYRLIAITVKPIERMVRMSQSYHDPDVLFFSEEQKRSEFGQLSMALNGMLYRIESDRVQLRNSVTSLEIANSELLKTQKEMVRTEKIASVGRLSAGLAHEIGNPIGIVQGYVELLQQPDIDQAEKQQFAQRALSELDRVNKLIRQLLDYAGSSSHEMSITNLHQLLEGVCEIVAFKKNSHPISLIKDIPVNIFIECDGESLRQVFLNCLLNALDALESKTGDFERQIIVKAKGVVEGEDHQTDVHIIMEDNGIGIEDKNLEAIFDPFFTTKDQGQGTGLGLFVSHSIIDAHGGKIWIESTLGKGSTVNIKLPVSNADKSGKTN